MRSTLIAFKTMIFIIKIKYKKINEFLYYLTLHNRTKKLVLQRTSQNFPLKNLLLAFSHVQKKKYLIMDL